MVMGPCGGVRPDGRCEVVPDPCVFPVPAEWAEPVPAVPLRAVPRILTDFSSEPYSVASVTAFMSDAVRAGVTIPVIAAVAVFTDEPSAAVLSGLPGLELDPAAVRRVLDDPDPVAAGITAAAGEARPCSASPAWPA